MANLLYWMKKTMKKKMMRMLLVRKSAPIRGKEVANLVWVVKNLLMVSPTVVSLIPKYVPDSLCLDLKDPKGVKTKLSIGSPQNL